MHKLQQVKQTSSSNVINQESQVKEIWDKLALLTF